MDEVPLYSQRRTRTGPSLDTDALRPDPLSGGSKRAVTHYIHRMPTPHEWGGTFSLNFFIFQKQGVFFFRALITVHETRCALPCVSQYIQENRQESRFLMSEAPL